MDIDIVIPWVDGSDPEWIREKNRYSSTRVDDSNSTNRFRDLGLMKYWFRGVEKYIPWFHKMYFVTWGHVPAFLNIDNPKLKIVRHEDFIPKDWLPTFSSHTIELNIHRIPELSEHFIYFNDDTYVTKELSPDYFFKDDLPCTQATEIPLGFIGKPEVWSYAAVNDIAIINKHFKKAQQDRIEKKKFINPKYPFKDNVRTFLFRYVIPDYYSGFKNFHSPAAFRKESFHKVWDNEPEILADTSEHKFRNQEDVNQWLVQWWQIASGQFVPGKVDNVRCAADTWATDSICETIKSQAHDMICINDPDDPTDFETNSKKIQAAFEAILPDKCSFEK